MSYGRRVRLDALFDARPPMSAIQSLEIQLAPILNNEHDIVNDSQFVFPKHVSFFFLDQNTKFHSISYNIFNIFHLNKRSNRNITK